MSNSQSPEQQLQSILKNISTGRDLTTGDITQESNTVNSNNTFITLIVSGKDSISSNKESLVSALSPILDQINPETIQQAYEKSLPPDADLWDLKSNDKEFCVN